MVTPAAKREAVAHLRSAFDMSERRACTVIGCVRMTVRYHSRRPDDAGLRQRPRALAHERRRFGYRRLHILLRREGFLVNHKRLFRIYRDERLMVRRRGGRKRALGTRAPMLVPQWPNDRWSLDFVADQFIDGRRMRILVVVDDCTRECLTLVADTSISGLRVARELDRLLVERGKPRTIVSDNGTDREHLSSERPCSLSRAPCRPSRLSADGGMSATFATGWLRRTAATGALPHQECYWTSSRR
jgi:putative transposase